MPNSDFIEFYKEIAHGLKSFIHPDDEAILKPKGLLAVHNAVKKDVQFISDLVPEPFAGDIMNAKIFMILNNPGFGGNEWAEQNLWPCLSPYFKKTLLHSLNLVFDDDYPFWPLNPIYKGFEGAKWWKKRLGDLATPAFSKIFASIEWVLIIPKSSTGTPQKACRPIRFRRILF